MDSTVVVNRLMLCQLLQVKESYTYNKLSQCYNYI